MLTLEMQFPAGRYHATPWERHVNEGQVEWPPSPWRIVRALLAVWKNRHPQIPESHIAELVGKLRGTPVYALPPSTTAHIRQYQKLFDTSQARLILDAFRAVSPEDSLKVRWPEVVLEPRERETLETLVSGLSYLGRAESWCDMRLSESSCTLEFTTVPATVRDGLGQQSIELLVPGDDAGLDDLMVDTDSLRKEGRDRPPGARSVRYLLSDASAPKARRKLAVRDEARSFALFSLFGSVRPLVQETLIVGERMRLALMKQEGTVLADIHGDGNMRTGPALSGRMEGAPLADQHRHAHYLPLDIDGDGRIDHVAVWVPMGISGLEVEAFGRLRRLYWERDRDPLRVALLGIGGADDFPGASVGTSSRLWRSVTPFLLTRHPKKKAGGWVDTPEQQIQRELGFRGLPSADVSPVQRLQLTGRAVRWLEFRRWRRNQRAPTGQAHGFELRFAEPVGGPIVLGFGAHFGLGRFAPIKATGAES